MPIFSAPEGISDDERALRAKYAEILQRDPIGRVRELVGSCRSSGQRRRDLERFIREGNESGYWKLKITGCERALHVRLVRDCTTRWSSTYLMIDRVTELYVVSGTSLQTL